MFYKTATKATALFVAAVMTLMLFTPIGISQSVYAAASEETEVTVSGKISTAVTIDGNLNESFWQSAEWKEVANRQEATTLNNSCEFATAWDSDYFYVAVKVVDSNVVTTNLNSNIIYNDSIEILIDPANAKATDSYDNTIMHFMTRPADNNWTILGSSSFTTDKKSSYPSTGVARTTGSTGYTVEVAFKFSEMGISSLKDGKMIGLEVINNDDDNASSSASTDIGTLYWNATAAVNSPVTWGSVCLYEKAKSVISYSGSPTIDGTISQDEGWVFTSSAADQTYGISFELASACDTKNIYFAADIKGSFTDNHGFSLGIDPINSKGNNSIGTIEIINLKFKNGDGEGRTSVNNNGEYIYTPNLSVKIKPTNNGYAVEVRISLNELGIDPKYLSTIGFDFAIIDGNKVRLPWANSNSEWIGSPSRYGSVVLNYFNVGGTANGAPTGNQLASYSIAQGKTLSNRVTVTDPDGDKLTYNYDPDYDVPGSSYGTLNLNTDTGAWSYSTPSNSFTGIVNYYFLVTDGHENYFHQRLEIRIENTPTYKTYYVDGDTGNDSKDGLSYQNAFKTIQAAANKVNPGDTVIIYESDTPYCYANKQVLQLTRSGLPDAYITYKAAEGEQPVINSNGKWNTVTITGSYIKFEGITLQGHGKTVQYDYEGRYKMYHSKAVSSSDSAYNPSWGDDISYYNTNGLSITPNNGYGISDLGIDGVKVIHHVEIRNCVFEYLTASGMGTSVSDYITIENNTIINNCWGNMYACSGISVLGTIDIDDNFDAHKIIVRNNITAGNRHFVPWLTLGRFSDGNGIIIDSTDNASTNNGLLSKGDKWGVQPYQAKILVANNLSYLNGGSGIHVFDGDNTDLINNTIFSNSATPVLGYSDFYASQANNINIYNNIVYSRTGKKMQISSGANSNVVYDNNLFYNYSNDNNLGQNIAGKNGKTGTVAGSNNIYGKDPLFANVYEVDHSNGVAYPSTWTTEMVSFANQGGYYVGADYSVPTDYDFSIAKNSPAVGSGNAEWSEYVGNTDNRMGVFGTIGSYHNPLTVNIAAARQNIPNTVIETNAASAVKTTGTVTVDGALNETMWANANWYDIDKAGPETTVNDNEVQFATAWDDTNLYVAVKVTDGTVVKQNLNSAKYCNDGIEIFIDPNNKKLNSQYDSKIVHLIYQAADGAWDLWGGEKMWTDIKNNYYGVDAKHTETADGYIVEAVFPFVKLGVSGLTDGKLIGIEVTNNDDDNAASSDTSDRGELFWNNAVSAKNPATWGNICLGVKAKPVVSTYGTPTVDGAIGQNEGWTFTSDKSSTAAATTYRLASMIDEKNLYLAMDITGEVTANTAVSFFIDPDNSKGVGNEDLFQFVEYSPVSNKCSYSRFGHEGGFDYSVDFTTAAQATDNGYSIEIRISLNELGYAPKYLNSLGMEVDFFKIKGNYAGASRVIWSSATGDSMWNSSSPFGTVLLNSMTLNYDGVKILNDSLKADANTAGNYNYEALLASSRNIKGPFVLAMYNGDRLVKTEIITLDTGMKTYQIKDSAVSDGITNYKMMMLKDLDNISPIATAVGNAL